MLPKMALFFLLALAAIALAAPVPQPTRICVTEHFNWYDHPLELVQQRFDYYEQLGVEVLRYHSGIPDCPLMQELARRDFKLKIILYVLGMPREWMDAHPGNAMVDEHGVADWHLGPWSPDFEQIVNEAAARQLELLKSQGLLDKVEELVADLGPAGEGIYPANWTLSREGEEAFWCYSDTAQADFRRAMEAKYASVEAANTAWGLAGELAFPTWEAVTIPQPGTEWAKGVFWGDMLTWYRDSKRRLMKYQIDNTLRLAKEYIGPDARVIVYLPGEAYTQQDWDEAVATASGNGRIRLMTDNDWLMDYALAHHCVLQYTGAENAAEVGRIVDKLQARGSDAYKLMWAENAGFEAIGRNPQWLAEVITAFDLRGVDLCWTNWLFEEDFVTPSPTFAAFEECCQGIRNYYATGRRYVSRPNMPTSLEESAPGVFELPCIADTRLIARAPDSLHGWDPDVAVFEGAQVQRALLAFPLELLPQGRKVKRATLHLTCFRDYGFESPVTLQVWRPTEDWSEHGASWIDRGLQSPWASPGGDYTGPGGQPFCSAFVPRLAEGEAFSLDVTPFLEAALAQDSPTSSLFLTLAPGDDGTRDFCSREHPEKAARPRLKVELAPL